MKKSEFTQMSQWFLLMGAVEHADYKVRRANRFIEGNRPVFLDMSQTPLVTAISGSFGIYDDFKRKERAEIVTTVWLTDGEDTGYYTINEKGISEFGLGDLNSSVGGMKINLNIQNHNEKQMMKMLKTPIA